MSHPSPQLNSGEKYVQRRSSATHLNLGAPAHHNPPAQSNGSPNMNRYGQRSPSPPAYRRRSSEPKLLQAARSLADGRGRFTFREGRRYLVLGLACFMVYSLYRWSGPKAAGGSALSAGRTVTFGREKEAVVGLNDKLQAEPLPAAPPAPPPKQPLAAPANNRPLAPEPAAAPFTPSVKKTRGLLDISLVSTRPEPGLPPLVSPAAAQPSVPSAELDAEVCPERDGEPCQFLVAAWLGEQETKAQMHLYQLGLLALTLGRTLVLPNVEKSRLSVCAPSPFDFYYDADALRKMGVPTIRYDQFVDWASQREDVPEAQVVNVQEQDAQWPNGVVEVDVGIDPTKVPLKPTRKLCMAPPRARLDFTKRSPLLVRPSKRYQAAVGKFGRLLVDTMRSATLRDAAARRGASAGQPEVLAFNYELRYDVLSPTVVASYLPDAPRPAPFAHWDYASQWQELAEGIADSLSPLVAIHWRTEELTASHLEPCVDSLFLQLESIQREFPSILNVYLATDYPLDEGATPRSGTMAKVITPQHHSAFKRLLATFGERLPGLRLTTFTKEEKRIGLSPSLQDAIRKGTLKLAADKPDDWEPSLADLDPGLVGILDKTVASRAEVFLAGSPGENKYSTTSCGKQSSFTGQVIDARRAARAKQGAGADPDELLRGMLWNSVWKWSTVGQNLDS